LVIHHHYKEVIATDSCFSLHLGLLLEDHQYELDKPVQLLQRTRSVILDSRLKPDIINHISIFKDGWRIPPISRWAFKYRNTEEYYSYKIPLFLEKLVVNPKKFYDSIDKTLKPEYLTEWFQEEQKDSKQELQELQKLKNTYLRDKLFIIVISAFACTEHVQYFERMNARHDVVAIFKHYADKFEELSIKVLQIWEDDKLSESQILENLCIKNKKHKTPEANTKEYELDESQKMWKSKNIIDLARMGKMSNFITNNILQTDLNATYLGAFQACPSSCWRRCIAFILSLLSFGLLAPALLRYQKLIVIDYGFWENLFSTRNSDQTRKETENRETGNSKPGSTTPKVIENEELLFKTDNTHEKDTKVNTEIIKVDNKFQYYLMPYFNHVRLFHQSPRTKIMYSMITEMLILLYMTYYLRNELKYEATKVVCYLIFFATQKSRDTLTVTQV